MTRLRLLPQADRDIDQVADEYADAGGLELGLRFLSTVEATWDELREHPLVGREYECLSERLQGIRRWRIRSPFEVYLVFYRLTEDVVEVVRVLHGSRDVATILLGE